MSDVPTAEALEQAALQLRPGARAKLAHRLVASLGGLSREELNALWLDEAERRDAEMEAGTVQAVPGEDVFARLENRYRK